MTKTAETLTERTRRLLRDDNAAEFKVSRAALETLVADSERYAELNKRISASLPIAQAIRRDGLQFTGETHVIRQTADRVWALVSVIDGVGGEKHTGAAVSTGKEP